ncbi:MAG TPA: hypothetical protein VJ896_10000 [Bacteroidales bacterium]|nr:hypothetical protein [Bacteroidales bacterium]
MDDIFDSLIYILITLAAFAISLMGKKKKPAERPPANFTGDDHSENKSSPFISDLDRFFDDHDEESVDSEEVEPSFVGESKPQQRATDNQIKHEILDDVPEQSYNNKEKMPYSMDHADTGEIYSEPIKGTDLTIEEEEERGADFDLEEAVIYSEILQRKEY